MVILSEFSQEEAYILGCLYGRGSIEEEKIILRFPHVSYDPVGEAIIKTLIEKKKGLSRDELYEIPLLKAKNVTNLGLKLASLQIWHPPRVEVKSHLIKLEGNVWRINDAKLAEEYLEWQRKYLERENSWKDYIMTTIRDVSSFITSEQIDTHREIDKFGHSTLIVECKVSPLTIQYLRKTYNMDVGDVYIHNTFSDSKTIFEKYDRHLKEHLIRGFADTTATIDRYISKEEPIYRVQFSVINKNSRLPIDVCFLLQQHLSIPVYYIGWAGLEGKRRNKTYAKRGGRDHLVKVWVTNFENRFNLPLFMNEQKHFEFLQALETSKKSSISPKLLSFCPFGRENRDYVKICARQGCKQVPSKQLFT